MKLFRHPVGILCYVVGICFSVNALITFVRIEADPTLRFMGTHDGRQPDAYLGPISNTCNPDGSQTFVWMDYSYHKHVEHFDTCIIKENADS